MTFNMNNTMAAKDLLTEEESKKKTELRFQILAKFDMISFILTLILACLLSFFIVLYFSGVF